MVCPGPAVDWAGVTERIFAALSEIVAFATGLPQLPAQVALTDTVLSAAMLLGAVYWPVLLSMTPSESGIAALPSLFSSEKVTQSSVVALNRAWPPALRSTEEGITRFAFCSSTAATAAVFGTTRIT